MHDAEPVEWGSIREPTYEEERDLRLIARRLPLLEVEVLEMTRLGIPQTEIASRLGLSQSTVSIRLSRAIERAHVYLAHRELLDLDEGAVAQRLRSRGDLDEGRITAASVWWATGSQAEAARRLGEPWTQGRVRHRSLRVLERITEVPYEATEPVRTGLQALFANAKRIAYR